MDIFSLTYVSSASELYSKDIYRDIALSSRAFNESHGITGMLLVFNETVMQFLEGPEIAIKALYQKIEADTRHKGPVIVSTRILDKREFPDWSMGYKELVDINDPSFIFNLDHQTLRQHFPEFVSGTTGALVNSFQRSSGMVAR